ncbi:helicase-related protein [Paraoerskovia marina]|uniref:helicase-related protein n=1 Tax=Paraoerskovia marina TaxID=545619 RepID=UPI00200AC12C|nr:helicase-related protein [Paraoerskovia marina]
MQARQVMEDAVRRELVGPIGGGPPEGKAIDCSDGKVVFATWQEASGRFHDETSKEEVLTQDKPLRRYGVGVLYPEAMTAPPTVEEKEAQDAELDGVTSIAVAPDEVDQEAMSTGEEEVESKRPVRGALDDDLDLTDANGFKPSAMAISFECRICTDSSLVVDISGAQYSKVTARIPRKGQSTDTHEETWWLRRPFTGNVTLPGQTLQAQNRRLHRAEISYEGDEPTVRPSLEVFSRPVPGGGDSDLRIVTVALVNRSAGVGDANAIFQAGFTVTTQGKARLVAYHEAARKDLDEEEQSLDLLYRNHRTYAVGHGCAARWDESNREAPSWVATDALPAYEVESLTPDIFATDDNGQRAPVTVSMRDLALGNDDGVQQVRQVLSLYEAWIAEQSALIPSLPERMQAPALRHMEEADRALARMHEGWRTVQEEPDVAQAFRWANEAMLFQQIRSSLPLRKLEEHGRGKNVTTAPVGAHPEVGDLQSVRIPARKGTWRPFQIAFILASLPELTNPAHPERALVDLIFFPTGGGKTEAYLGAAAVSLLARRLRDPNDAGTDTIMRYTLRLLTAQQFLRAASLVCVLEELRTRRPEGVATPNRDRLGTEPFRIGIWLGGTSTPNTWDQASRSRTALGKEVNTQNKFLLLRCPWCGTQMGPYGKASKNGQKIAGYVQQGKQVVFECADEDCYYADRPMPVQVVDADIYANPPSILIGTVDKFAMLAWKPEARAIFGLESDGSRTDVSPPTLVLQDELHLISGPLGSMVGMYEAIINDLCTDHRPAGPPVPPKIIAATATIRSYKEQIRNLYGRSDVALFPPHGLEEGRSFFAEPDRAPDGSKKPGRKYLGVMSASLGSTQTVQVRVAAAIALGREQIPEESEDGGPSPRDGYWTNLNFFNSLRELGNTLSLLESDIPDRLHGLRKHIDGDFHFLRNYMELTSRRRSDEIPKAIEKLQVPYGKVGCVDVCLASNIIEVGVDINRLGLMTIIGQPKTTAQYIQVSGRVGRNPRVSPGLVITLYGAGRPRDRSHYERFRTYHQQLYAQVEPTSVTPFATPVLRRALHGAVISYIRQTSDAEQPFPFPEEKYWEAVELLKARAYTVEEGTYVETDDVAHLQAEAEQRAAKWRKGGRTVWDANVGFGDPDNGLIRFAGTLPKDGDKQILTWDTPSSMRTVDAECRLDIRKGNAYIENDPELQPGGSK